VVKHCAYFKRKIMEEGKGEAKEEEEEEEEEEELRFSVIFGLVI